MGNIAIERVDAAVYRAPLETPVETSFGTMHDRPMVVVTVTDTDGATGRGEVWCNFPQVGAEHRARLAMDVAGAVLCGTRHAGPPEAFRHMTEKLAVLALQSGEPGPLANVVAGIDIAIWDLDARRSDLPLWKHLNHALAAPPRLPLYASGLNPTAPERLAERRLAEGYRAFKLKVGFGEERDMTNARNVRTTIGGDCKLMVDANQAWDLGEAVRMGGRLSEFGLDWLEEPLRADRPASEWQALKAAVTIPVAAGENFLSEDRFADALNSGFLDVFQPDIAKWGGFSGVIPVAKRVLAAGRRYHPHYLGGGIGLLASAHALAAVEGPGSLEVDANDNPLRSLVLEQGCQVSGGEIVLTDEPGLGLPPSLDEIERFRVL